MTLYIKMSEDLYQKVERAGKAILNIAARPDMKDVEDALASFEAQISSGMRSYLNRVQQMKDQTARILNKGVSKGKFSNFPTAKATRTVSLGPSHDQIEVEIVYEGVPRVGLLRNDDPTQTTLYAVIKTKSNKRNRAPITWGVYDDGRRIDYSTQVEKLIAEYLMETVAEALAKYTVKNSEMLNLAFLSPSFEGDLVCEVADMLQDPHIREQYKQLITKKGVNGTFEQLLPNLQSQLEELTQEAGETLNATKEEIEKLRQRLQDEYTKVNEQLEPEKQRAIKKIEAKKQKTLDDLAKYERLKREEIDTSVDAELKARNKQLRREISGLEKELSQQHSNLAKHKGTVKDKKYFLDELRTVFPDYTPIYSPYARNEAVDEAYRSGIARKLYNVSASKDTYLSSEELMQLVKTLARKVSFGLNTKKHDSTDLDRIIEYLRKIARGLNPKDLSGVREAINNSGNTRVSLKKIRGVLDPLLG